MGLLGQKLISWERQENVIGEVGWVADISWGGLVGKIQARTAINRLITSNKTVWMAVVKSIKL
jgi:hypothetical protein